MKRCQNYKSMTYKTPTKYVATRFNTFYSYLYKWFSRIIIKCEKILSVHLNIVFLYISVEPMQTVSVDFYNVIAKGGARAPCAPSLATQLL